MKGYLQIKCANPGRIVRKVCHFSKTSSCSNQSFGDGGSPPKTWGSPLAFFDREIRRPGERGGWWWSSPRVTPTRWKSFLSRFPIKFDERQESGASRCSIRCGVRACSSASMSPTTTRTRAPRPSVFPSSMCTAYTGSSQGGFYSHLQFRYDSIDFALI